jgi:hypothetical protein
MTLSADYREPHAAGSRVAYLRDVKWWRRWRLWWRCVWQTYGVHELDISAERCRYCHRKWSDLYKRES